MAAFVAIIVLLVGAWFTIDPLATATDSPGEAKDARSAQADDTACLLGMRNATLDLDRDFIEKLNGSGVRIAPSAPATLTADRGVLTVPVRGASGVTCLARAGIIGFRGGLTFLDANRELTMRKWRIVLDEKNIETFLAAGNPVPIAGLSVDLERADRVVRGQRLSLNADVKLGDGGLAALNLTFGTTLEAEQRVGRLVLGVREIKPEPKPPPAPEPTPLAAPTGPRVSLLG